MNDERKTPPDLFKALDKEFSFTLDAAATKENALCKLYWTKEQNALVKPWWGRVWCNPPYSKGMILAFVRKAIAELEARDAGGFHTCDVIVMLLPSDTSTKVFHEEIAKHADHVRFVKGRLKFDGLDAAAKFGSMVVIFRRAKGFSGRTNPLYYCWDWRKK